MATDIIGALGAGSGVDVKSLAQSLVDVEKMPRESAINTKIDNQERRIAGYSALMLSLETVKTAFQKLNDLSDFNAGTVSNSQPTALSAVTTSAAVPGRHTVEVQQLAASQRDASNAFASTTTSLNSGSAFSIQLTLDAMTGRPKFKVAYAWRPIPLKASWMPLTTLTKALRHSLLTQVTRRHRTRSC